MSDAPRRAGPPLGWWLLVPVSGAAYVAAFPPADQGWLAWVALTPLLLAASGRGPRGAFWTGYLWGVVAFGGVLAWLVDLGPVVWAMATVLMAVFPGVALLLSAAAGSHGMDRRALLWFPVCWTAVEFLRSQGPLGFPWALLGESQHRALVVSQVAGLAGVYGVSFLVALVNSTLALLFLRRAGAAVVVATGSVLLATVLWGTALLHTPIPASVVAAVVQPEYALRTGWDPSRAARDLAVLKELTRSAAARRAAVVVWPETASPTDIVGNPSTFGRIRSWVRRDHVSLIVTSLEGGVHNAAFSFAPDGALLGRYHKQHLVPFAEVGEVAGHGPAVLPTPLGPVGVAICYESTFPQMARRSVREGATLLAVLTNDAWFGGPWAAAQHAAIAPFRAIEEGRYLLRAANAGWSQIIDPRGRVLASLPPGVRGIATAAVAPLSSLSVYAHWGDVFGWSVVTAVAVAVLPAAGSLAGDSKHPAFRGLLTASVAPLAVLLAVDHVAPAAPWGARGLTASLPWGPVAALGVVALLSRRLSPRLLGFTTRGGLPAGLLAGACVAGLSAVARDAFVRHGGVLLLIPPPGGWWAGGAVQVLVVGLFFEGWLRGLVFHWASAWRGAAVAVLWGALLGMLAAAPRGPEAMVWELTAGLLFGALRVRWPQVPALALAHGAGNLLLGFLTSPW